MLAVVVAVTVVAQSGAGQRALRSIGIVAARDGYSEVAFATPSKLPPKVRSSRPLHVAFTVTNHEREALSYGWHILQSNGQQALASGQLELSQGQRAYLNPVISPTCSGRIRISVVLGSRQQIGFWTDCGAARRHNAPPAAASFTQPGAGRP